MECTSALPGFVSYLYCQFAVFLQPYLVWLEQHPRQISVGLLTLLLLLGFLWWSKGTQRFRQTANQRAEQLLKQSLTPQQYQQLDAQGFLELPSTVTPWNFYRIPRYPGRVQVYETYKVNSQVFYRLKADLCVISSQTVPDADLILAHKWMIEGDEQTYTAIANWYVRHNQTWMVYNADKLPNPV